MFCLRVCGPGGKSLSKKANDFIWPLKIGATVVAPDWDPNPVVGGGLHGIQIGKHSGFSMIEALKPGNVWVVFKSTGEHVSIGTDGLKCESAEIVDFGPRLEILKKLTAQGYSRLPHSTNIGKDYSVNLGGYNSMNTGEHCSTNNGDDYSVNIGKRMSINCGGVASLNHGSENSKNTGGDHSKNIGFDFSINTGADYSFNSGGIGSVNSGGVASINVGGKKSFNSGGIKSSCSGGEGSILSILYLDRNRLRALIGYVGENGIEPNTLYAVRAGRFVKIRPASPILVVDK